jgi:hypothetical protein
LFKEGNMSWMRGWAGLLKKLAAKALDGKE